jgi:hypothetical protein
LVKLAAGVEVISVFFVSAVLAKQGPMVAAVAQSINIGVVFAENLEVALSLSDNTFDNIICLDSKRLLSISCAVIFAVATGTLEIPFLRDSLLCILGVLDHFSGDALPASSVSAAHHDDRLSLTEVEAVLAVEAVQFD